MENPDSDPCMTLSALDTHIYTCVALRDSEILRFSVLIICLHLSLIRGAWYDHSVWQSSVENTGGTAPNSQTTRMNCHIHTHMIISIISESWRQFRCSVKHRSGSGVRKRKRLWLPLVFAKKRSGDSELLQDSRRQRAVPQNGPGKGELCNVQAKLRNNPYLLSWHIITCKGARWTVVNRVYALVTHVRAEYKHIRGELGLSSATITLTNQITIYNLSHCKASRSTSSRSSYNR